MYLNFYKYQGTGNDFVVIDNRAGEVVLTKEQVFGICDRHFGVGADGLMLLNASLEYDFVMQYYNADGNESSMCGNGGRCLTKFAFDRGIVKDRYRFLAMDGVHEAILKPNGWVELKMKDVEGLEKWGDDFIVNTGSPHYVRLVVEVESVDVFNSGRDIRNSDAFVEDGINVNFVEKIGVDKLFVRTYERGVEDETLSCGTGVTAAAIAYSNKAIFGQQYIDITTKGGQLGVGLQQNQEGGFENIWLCGPAVFVFSGVIEV